MPFEKAPDQTARLTNRIRELEGRLSEADETLNAIRHGEIDAVVVVDRIGEHRIYTLESADRPYRVLIEQMQEGAVTLGEDGSVLYCNRRFAEMLRIAQERVVGQCLQQFVQAGDVAKLDDLLNQARIAGVRTELVLRAADGTDFSAYVSLSLLHDNGATLLCGVITDLTEQKLRLQELAEANSRLSNEIAERNRIEDALRHAQKMEALGQLTGGIAHDFNNMLQGVMSGITLARQRIAKSRSKEAPEFLDAALMAADRAAALTRRLLSFGRRQALNPKHVVLDSLFREVAELIRQTVGPGIETDLYLEEGCWPVSCDQNQFENALINLAINARDAMSPAGGRLTIGTNNLTLGEAHTRDWVDAEPGDYVRITVADTGTGMPPDVLAHVFEPFFTTKPDGHGTGLGLSQLYGFIRQSHGMVRIESEPGKGTAVHLYLPRSRDAPSDGPLPGAIEGQRQSTPIKVAASVLLVEDEATVRGFAAETLRELGYRVVEARNGIEGLKALQEELRPSKEGGLSLLVTDIGLPGGLNGRQLADAARDLDSHLPILLITGYAGDALEGHGRLGPGMEILSKPFKLDVLAKRVQAMIGQG